VRFGAIARREGVLELRSRQVPDTVVMVPLSDLRPGSVAGWAAYPAGVCGHTQAGIGRGASVLLDGDLLGRWAFVVGRGHVRWPCLRDLYELPIDRHDSPCSRSGRRTSSSACPAASWTSPRPAVHRRPPCC